MRHLALLLAPAVVLGGTLLAMAAPPLPPGLLLRGEDVAAARDRVQAGDAALASAADRLARRAEAALVEPIVTVIEKSTVPPSGDKHDYVSLSPYWWPNPGTPDGLPYVRRDGEVNPERDDYDLPRLDAFTKSVNRLAWGYYFTGDERYAARAVEWLRAWFLDEATRMNPRMQYGQFVPGVSEGRNYGIIETNRFRWFPDAIVMLEGSPAMTPEVREGVRGWFDEYLTWLLTSELGEMERSAPNNHGTWAAAQVALYARFTGRDDVARQMLDEAKRRVASQIEPDGRQPHELERTRPLHYSVFNLRALMDLARHGEALGIDLWGYRTDDGRSIRVALDFLLPYMTREQPFPYEQLQDGRDKDDTLAEALRMAGNGFGDASYHAAMGQLEVSDDSAAWLQLLMPVHGD